MGLLRFVLALCVLVSHTPLLSFEIGVVAVVVFYMLAGFVMAHLYFYVFASNARRARALLCDRLLRIYPLYLYAFALCSGFVLLFGYYAPHFTPANVAAHLLVIPLNYFMFFDFGILQRGFEPELNHLTWSLGAEIQAYLLLLLGFLFPLFLRLAAALSFAVFLCAIFGIIDTDIYGYRLLAGIFFVFALGSWQRRTSGNATTAFAFIVSCVALALFGIGKALGVVFLPYAREVLLGLALAPWLIVLFQNRRGRANKLLGALSYGIFLTHTPAMWILDVCGIPKAASLGYVGAVAALAIVLALFGIVAIERPIERYRLRVIPKS